MEINYKLGKNVKNWKKRFAVLKDDVLIYYKDVLKHPMGLIYLPCSKIYLLPKTESMELFGKENVWLNIYK